MVDGALRPLHVAPAAPPKDIARHLLQSNCVSGPSGVLARTDLLRALGGFDPLLSGTEDWDMWIRLAAEAPGACVPDVLWASVVHGANKVAGTVQAETRRPQFEILVAKHGAAAERLGFRFGSIGWTRWVASRHRSPVGAFVPRPPTCRVRSTIAAPASSREPSSHWVAKTSGAARASA